MAEHAGRDAARAAISAKDNDAKADTLREIATEQATAGDRDAARVNFKAAAQATLGAPLPSPDELAGPQYDPNQVALRDIAKSQAEAGFGADAIQTAQYLPTDLGNSRGGNDIQSLVLAAIADILANAGDFENAVKYQAEAVKLDPHSAPIGRQLKTFRRALAEAQAGSGK